MQGGGTERRRHGQPYLDLMAQGPLALPKNLHKMPRHLENLLSKFDLNKKTKAEDHIDDFYMHLSMLEVRYDDISCILFPYIFKGRVATWHYIYRVSTFTE